MPRPASKEDRSGLTRKEETKSKGHLIDQKESANGVRSIWAGDGPKEAREKTINEDIVRFGDEVGLMISWPRKCHSISSLIIRIFSLC